MPNENIKQGWRPAVTDSKGNGYQVTGIKDTKSQRDQFPAIIKVVPLAQARGQDLIDTVKHLKGLD